jgi:integrase
LTTKLQNQITLKESNLSDATKIEYLHRVNLFYKFSPIKSDSELIDCPSEELQSMLLSYTRYLKQRVDDKTLSANTIPKMFRGIKWLLNSNYRENDIKWKPIEAIFPRSVKRSGYKAWTSEEIALMVEKSKDLRNKSLIHFQASTGGRVGIHNHSLLMKHIVKMEFQGHGCYAVLCYADEDETVLEKDTREKQSDVQSGDSYWTFLTPEATDALDKYHVKRQRGGEYFDEDTPLFIKEGGELVKGSVTHTGRWKNTRQLNDNNITGIIQRILNDLPQIKRKKKTGERRYDVQINHGFRKRTNTILKLENSVNSNIAEKLLGHKNGLDGVYFTPTRQECFNEFVKCIAQLSVSDSERQKLVITSLESEKTDLLEANARIESLEKKFKPQIDEEELQRRITAEVIAALNDPVMQRKRATEFADNLKKPLKKLKGIGEI